MTSSEPDALIGRQVGNYRILGLLGEGGMGAVYRAKDARLRRDVALKILPAAAAADSLRRERFLREARAASALNHPNIVSVYDVGTIDGITFIVSELVEGASLRDEAAEAPVPMKQLLAIGAQIADGLAAAHHAGIVHRDIKPENVMVARDGRVKILDFGLAKTVIPADSQSGAPSRVTRTEPGLIVGTVPYMSPEQARGGDADFRTDQFSFGLVLYELATGVPAFRAETAVQTLSAIITDEARPVGELNPRVPVALRWIIERCLAKDPAQRYGSTLDLAHDLRTLRDRLAEATTPPESTQVSAATWPRVGWLTAALAAAAAAGVWVSTAIFPGFDLASYNYTPIATEDTYQGAPAWSPNGEHLAYVADVNGVTQVFTRKVGSSDPAVQITHTPYDCHDPFWSPDGAQIYFISLAGSQDALWSVNAVRGEPAMQIENVGAAAIAPNGTLALLHAEGSATGDAWTLWMVSDPSNPRRYDVKPFDTLLMASGVLHFSPDGKKLGISAQSWNVVPGSSPEQIGPHFWTISLDDRPEKQVRTIFGSLPALPAGAVEFSWWPDNRHVVAAINEPLSGTHLWTLDSESDDVRRFTVGPLRDNFPAISPDAKRIAYTQEEVDFDLFEVKLDGSRPKPIRSTSRNELSPSWSPSEPKYVYETDRSGVREIWLRHPTAGVDAPLVRPADFPGPATFLGNPTFSPDGQLIAFERNGPAKGEWRIWLKSVSAGGPPLPLAPASLYKPLSRGLYQDSPTWSPQSVWIAFNQLTESGGWKLMKARVGGAAPPDQVLDDIVHGPCPWSPDGLWIACEMAQGLTLVSPAGGKPRVIADQQFLAYGWARNSTTIYGIRPGDDSKTLVLSAVEVATGHERVITENLGPLPRISGPVRGFSRIDDKTFLTSVVRLKSDIWMLEGFPPPRGLLERWLSRPWWNGSH
jgi:serine/threonine protein kinase/Tol biopolymer transport system component